MKMQVEETPEGLLWTSPEEPGRAHLMQNQDFTLTITMESGQQFTVAGAGYFEDYKRRQKRCITLEHQLRKSWWGRRFLRRVKRKEMP